ncbi:hypothetical protein JCM10207_003423 [Rhodosporidiobolus poonsookiae]
MVSSKPSPSAAWQPLGTSSFYRSLSAYSLAHSPLSQLDLSDHWVASSRNGGPLAVMRNPHRPVLVSDATSFKRDKGATVRVYSAAGALLQTIVWDSPPSPVASLLYPSLPSHPDTLLILLASGQYRLYPLSVHPSLAAPYTQLSLPGADEAGGVVDAKEAGEGAVVVRYKDARVVEVRGLERAAEDATGAAAEEAGLDGVEGFPLASFGPNSSSRGGRASSKRAAGQGGVKTVPFAPTGLSPEESRNEVVCWTVLPGETNASRGTEVLLGLSDGRVVRVDEIDAVEQRLPADAIPPSASSALPTLRFLTPSPSGRFLAALLSPRPSPPSSPSSSRVHTLLVLSASLDRLLSSTELSAAAVGEEDGEGGEGEGGVRQVEWCGSNAVAVRWERTVEIVGPFGETLKYFYSSPSLHLTTEVDCVRVTCGEDTCDLIELVPPATLSALLPSPTPPSQLLAASTLFHARSPKADEIVRGLLGHEHGHGGAMREAVEGCVAAAGREWTGGEGKELLRAAAFGKSFLEAYNPSEFVSTTKTLRVLNAVRDFKVGLPLTWEQYHLHPPSTLISRLLARSEHLLALRLSAFLGLPAAPVVKHWARDVIAASAPSAAGAGAGKGGGAVRGDEEVCRVLVDKLRSLAPCPSSPAPSGPLEPSDALSPASLALTAFALGRPHLARLLVDQEPRSARQVPLLVRMGDGEGALRRAVMGGEGELVFAVLLSLRRTLPPGDLFRLLERVDASLSPPSSHSTSTSSAPTSARGKRGPASRAFELYCRELGTDEERRLRWEFWYQDDRRREMGMGALEESFREEDFGEKVAKVRKAQKSFAEDKEAAFEAKMVDDHIRLLALQQSLEQENTGKSFVGLSVNGTIRACILAGLDKKAEKVRNEFRVPDKRYWYLRLRALTTLRDFPALLVFSKSKKSPIGYEPFVDELIKAGAHREAVSYVERCESRSRVELYVRCGEWGMAGQECVRRAERGRLVDLKPRAPNALIAAQLDEYLQEMNNAGM